jgi:hypothetical protein
LQLNLQLNLDWTDLAEFGLDCWSWTDLAELIATEFDLAVRGAGASSTLTHISIHKFSLTKKKNDNVTSIKQILACQNTN